MMELVIRILLGVIAVEHLVIAGLEMVGSSAKQATTFAMAEAFVRQPEAKVALANQGIYNAMFALMLVGTLFFVPTVAFTVVARMLMGFLLVVGAYGAVTVTPKIWGVQVAPAVIMLVLLIF